MGYHGNLKKLWREMDCNKNGFVSLREIHEETGDMIGSFKIALMKKHGDMLTAWRKGLDTNGTGRVEEYEVQAAVKALGLDLNAKKLFGMLKSSPGGLGLTLMDFDP